MKALEPFGLTANLVHLGPPKLSKLPESDLVMLKCSQLQLKNAPSEIDLSPLLDRVANAKLKP